MKSKTKHWLKKQSSLLLIFFLSGLFLLLNVFYLKRNIGEVGRSILEDGLPSLLVIVVVTLIVEFSIRKRERRAQKEFFEQIIESRVGFAKYVTTYPKIPDGLARYLRDADGDSDVEVVKVLMIGADSDMLKSIVESLQELHIDGYFLEIRLLDPESPLAVARGEAIGQGLYQQHIRTNLDSLVKKLKTLAAEQKISLKRVKLESYSRALPSNLMIQFGEELIAFSPVWSSESVKDGPFCFVPKGNLLFSKLAESYERVDLRKTIFIDGTSASPAVKIGTDKPRTG